jgi:hypothetical protein
MTIPPSTAIWALLLVQALVLLMTMIGVPGPTTLCRPNETAGICLREWQTFITGVLAVIVGVVTYGAMKRQTEISRQLHDEARRAKEEKRIQGYLDSLEQFRGEMNIVERRIRPMLDSRYFRGYSQYDRGKIDALSCPAFGYPAKASSINDALHELRRKLEDARRYAPVTFTRAVYKGHADKCRAALQIVHRTLAEAEERLGADLTKVAKSGGEQ